MWCRHLKLATLFRHALNMCLEETEFRFRSLLQNYFLWITNIFWPYHTILLFVSPQLLLQHLMQAFETCDTVQTCTADVHKETEFWFRSLLQNYVPLNNIYIRRISHCSIVHVLPLVLIQQLIKLKIKDNRKWFILYKASYSAFHLYRSCKLYLELRIWSINSETLFYSHL